MGSRKQRIDVVIPIFNEEEVLPFLFERLKNLKVLAKGVRWKFIFVNDGSTDRSAMILDEASEREKAFSVVEFSRNFGHQAAVTAGIDYSDGDAVVIMDADLQDPPELILEMINRWRSGFQIVYGTRTKRRGESLFKRLTASVFYRLLQRATDYSIPVDTGDFRLMDRSVVDVFKKLREKHRFIRGMVSWVGFSSAPVEYERQVREAGTTKYPLAKMMRFAMDAVLSFSTMPIRFVNYIGLFVFSIGVLGAVAVLVLRLFTSYTVPGISAVLLSVLILGGIQILMIGLSSEYLGRIYEESKGRPIYVVKTVKRLRAPAFLRG